MKITLEGAIEASKQNKIEEWIHEMLLKGENPNLGLSSGLKKEKRIFIGPTKIKLSDFQRVSGPEEDMLYKVDEAHFHHHVSCMVDAIHASWKVPPLLIECQDDGFYLSGGNHRYEALRRSGLYEYYAIFWCTT